MPNLKNFITLVIFCPNNRGPNQFSYSFIWSKFEEAKLESKGFEKVVKSFNDLQMVNLERDISFATLRYSGLYFFPSDPVALESWIEGAFELELYNEPQQENHPFIVLRVYPQLYKRIVKIGEEPILIGEASRLNKERFNHQFKSFVNILNGVVNVCGSELGYELSKTGIF